MNNIIINYAILALTKLPFLCYSYRFSMKRPYEDIVESHKRRKEACVGQKRHQNENYDSQLSLKKPNLDIKTCKTGVCVCVYVRCGSVRFTLLLCRD